MTGFFLPLFIRLLMSYQTNFLNLVNRLYPLFISIELVKLFYFFMIAILLFKTNLDFLINWQVACLINKLVQFFYQAPFLALSNFPFLLDH